MSDQHLGDDVHDLLDNRLSAARAAQAMSHLESCPDCRMRWDDLRRAREALQTSSAGIDMTFAQQLLDRDRMAEIAKGESRHQARAARPRDRRPMLAAVIMVVAMTAGVGAAYLAGAPDEVSLEFAEPAGTATGTLAAGGDVTYVEARSMRGGDALRSWVHPDWEATGLTPVEGAVLRSATGENVFVATILANLEPIVITEQHGRLSSAFAEHFPSVDLGHTSAYLVSDDPRQLVWQTGDVVISATCSCALSTLESVAACFPAQSDPGFVDRVAAGLREFTAFASPDR
ncbi:anti-sigma factor family protein [Demequina muriae]|uniref:Zf-HC2 domain-containing protein n=1 Tax=Demequina muriae TaxID=3051664 RepID=A0ABT8GEX4_9MICO|nr:zf-HC2 domain-containing protein [Demequina sp. EGI L300058]MDN4479981.1 zf-HC2 domain-containing protein [Demequina sp. EGI L300058]